MKIETIQKKYADRLGDYYKKEKRLEKIKKKLENMPYPHWIEEIIEPIAKKLAKKFPKYTYDILGPFGICARTSIHFYKKGVAEKDKFEGNNCLSITFEPRELKIGEIAIVNKLENTGTFAKGTLGEINGMNHPILPMIYDLDKLTKYIKLYNKKKR